MTKKPSKLWWLVYPLAVVAEATISKFKSGAFQWKRAHKTVVDGLR